MGVGGQLPQSQMPLPLAGTRILGSRTGNVWPGTLSRLEHTVEHDFNGHEVNGINGVNEKSATTELFIHLLNYLTLSESLAENFATLNS